MSTHIEVEQFLKDFKSKLSVFSILYRDERGKNTQALADLEISPVDRDKIVLGLMVEDYCHGPLDDVLYGIASMWVFGKEIKGHQVYIKISMGRPGSSVICISFHIAEFKLVYPFK